MYVTIVTNTTTTITITVDIATIMLTYTTIITSIVMIVHPCPDRFKPFQGQTSCSRKGLHVV